MFNGLMGSDLHDRVDRKSRWKVMMLKNDEDERFSNWCVDVFT